MFSISRHSDFTPSGATCSALSNSFPPVTMAGRAHALSLYKSILRAHAKYMPLEMRQLGDAYVKAEFRLHKSVTKTDQLEQFFTEWDKYLRHVEHTGRQKQSRDLGLVDSPPSSSDLSNHGQQPQQTKFGRDMTNDVEFNEEQMSQLEQLREEAARAGRGK
eukprot:g2830.t1 g2830   contig12:881981-882620(-)